MLTCGTISGIIAPVMIGYFVKTTGSFFWGFAAVAMVVFVGAFMAMALFQRGASGEDRAVPGGGGPALSVALPYPDAGVGLTPSIGRRTLNPRCTAIRDARGDVRQVGIRFMF